VSQEDALKAELAAARATIDALRADLEAERRKSDERRERFEAEVDRLEARLARSEHVAVERREALARERAQLQRPFVRTAAKGTRLLDALGRAVASLRGRSRSGAGSTGPVAGRSAADEVEAARDVRRRLADATGDPDMAQQTVATVRVGIVDDAPREVGALRAALEAVGLSASVVDASGTGGSWDPSIDVAVVTSPRVHRRRLPRGVISIALVTGPADAWLADPGFDDHDLVFAGDEDSASAIRKRTAKDAETVDLERPEILAQALRARLHAWALAPKIAIHIAPRNWEAAATWGDTQFARGLQRAFERQGWHATVHIAPEADDAPAACADVALHLFGTSVPPVRPGQLSVLWVISHPDRLRASVARSYDHVFVASESFAEDLARRIDRPVRTLHQATDPDRFHPDPSGPRHALLFVGNSRGARRPILDALAGTDHDLAVYGGAWSPELLDPRYLRGTWIPNEDLHRYYSGAEIVLNDHWPDMRHEGFVSNRVYDALASGAFVVSDSVPGIEDRFDGSVATFDSRDELIAVVDHYLAHPAERQERATRGRAAVLARHTFDHRAAAIIEATRGSSVGDRQSA